MSSDTLKTRYRVGGMDCASCANKIETAVGRLPGVGDVGVSVAAGTLTVAYTDRSAAMAVEQQVKALGYTIAPADESGEHANALRGGDQDHADLGEGPWWKTRKEMLTLGCGVALVLAYFAGRFIPAIETWAFLAAMMIGLVPIARRALVAALAGTPFSIETLMSIAAMGAVVIGAVEEAAVVVFLFLVGELLEGVAAGRARASIRDLASLVPKTALLEEGGQTREVPAEGLAVGSVIVGGQGTGFLPTATSSRAAALSMKRLSPARARPNSKRPGMRYLRERSTPMPSCAFGSRRRRPTTPLRASSGWSKRRRRARRQQNVSSIGSRHTTRPRCSLPARLLPCSRRSWRGPHGPTGFTKAWPFF